MLSHCFFQLNFGIYEISCVLAPGGGGYGLASERARTDILSDVKEGYVSNADAIRQYSLDESDI